MTLLDHSGECGFPNGICTVRAHRVMVHEKCGRELEMRFCGCGATGFTYDPDRGWWVHYACGWPTKLWFDAHGTRAPEHLRGLRPVTYHEFVTVPMSPRKRYERLDERQRALNKEFDGHWVRD